MFLEHIQAFITVLLLGNTGFVVMFGQNCTKKDMNTSIVCNYFPSDIDKNVSHVYIVDYSNTMREVITDKNFSSKNWRYVEYLELGDKYKILQATFYFKAKCFESLTFLRELRLHINRPILSSDAFFGLDSLTVLDVSGSGRLKYPILIPALNGSYKMPRLEKLYLSGLNHVYGAFPIDNNFVEVLLPRNITHLDLSNCQITIFNVTAIATKLLHLQAMNLSYSVLGQGYSRHLDQKDIRHIKSIDLSGATLPMQSGLLPGKVVLKNVHVFTSKLHPSTKLAVTSETMNYSAVVRKYTSVWIYNVTSTIDKNLEWSTRDLILQQNNFKRLDISVNCSRFNITSIKLLDISKNGMEFLHPSFLSCMPNLKTVRLSNNNLHVMVAENVSLFEQLFFQLLFLKHITLAGNLLGSIPLRLFQKNEMIETIDLSNNDLQQVHFDVHNLDHLQVLDLRNNKIVNLDSTSINNLNSIPTWNSSSNYSRTVLFTSNPISCSKCTTKTFLKWILTTNLTDESSQNLTCYMENDKKVSITRNTLHQVEKICSRNTLILAGSISGSIMFLLTILAIGLFIKKRHTLRMQNRSNIISLLHEGEGHHEFVAYLAYSSDDQDFVSQYVLRELNEELQLMTGIDRELICTGDVHLRFGFDIHSEIVRCIERSSTVIVVVSKNFCTSEYCQNELEQAYLSNKPIVLMFKGYVPEQIMMPRMKELYQKNVRMLWAFENGSYILKSTWENVCTSILDLVNP